MPAFDLTRRLVAEWLGTALLVAVVVGSGIMGERLAHGIEGVALLGNTLATGAALVVLVLVLGPVSSAHFNPAVSFVFALRGELSWRCAAAYVPCQLAGGVCGTLLAHLMFAMPPLLAGTKVRAGSGILLGEFVATFALLATIIGCRRFRPDAVPYAVGLVITAGYWFTSSTSFANPAVTVARALTDGFAGIRPVDAPGFILMQLAGTLVAAALFGWLLADRQAVSASAPAQEVDRAAE